MRVLAFDPGYERLGLAVLDRINNAETLVHSECVRTDASESLPDRLHTLGIAVRTALETYTPDAVALETLFFNKNQKTAMAVAEVRGMLLFLAKTHDCAIYEYKPQEIKIATTGYGKSDKHQVTEMVKRLLPNVPNDALDDEYDAIAVGLTCLASVRYPQTAR